MRETKHTPGPWHAINYAGFWQFKSEPFYDSGFDLTDEDECKEAPSNAKLMAASPDLLESLKEMLEHHNSDEWKIVKSKAYEAIKKATV